MQAETKSLETPPEMLSPAAKRLRQVQDEILAKRNIKPTVYIPPPVSAQVAEQTRMEMEEGAKRVALASANKVVRPRDPADGTSTPVYRPREFVPKMDQGQKADKSYKTL